MSASESTTVYHMPSPLSLFPGGVPEPRCQHVMSLPIVLKMMIGCILKYKI